MTRKGEERAVAIPVLGDGEGLALEGLFVAGSEPAAGGVVIAPPHPLYGGSMESPVVSELAWACTQTGLASLRFNWRGCGASGGVPNGEAAAADADFCAALEQLSETVDGPLVCAGYSFGAGAALRAAARERRVRGLVLVAPPPQLVAVEALGKLDARILILGGELDGIAPPDALEALAHVSPRARWVRIPGADHFFAAGLAGIGAAAREWLTED